jgi:hypothetical protein
MGYAFVGLAFPVLLTAILSITGLALPLAVPAAAGIGLAIGMSFLPEVELRRRAAVARVQMRRTVCVYLELVALERAADAGAVAEPRGIDQFVAAERGYLDEVIMPRRLRRKLDGAVRNHEELIRTVRNEGYMFTPKVTRR